MKIKKRAFENPENNIYLIEDLDSTNGTFVNGRKIKGVTKLTIHDKIYIGRYQLSLDGKVKDLNEELAITAVGIEKSILDKMGENEVKFEKDGFTTKTGKWITYEEVSNDRRPIHYEEVLGTRVATRTPEVREA
jgi:pSer/pThr/pTyr-binding forkhead associated (FHA) protein